MLDLLFFCVGDCLVADVQICFQEFLNWRHDQTVRFAQHAMEERKIGRTVAWLLAASSSCSPHRLGVAKLSAALQPQLADEFMGRTGPTNPPQASRPPFALCLPPPSTTAPPNPTRLHAAEAA